MGVQVELEQLLMSRFLYHSGSSLRNTAQEHWTIQAEAALEAFLGSGGHTPPQEPQTTSNQRQA